MSKKNKNKPKNKPSVPTGSGSVFIKPKWQHILLIIVLGFIVYSNSLNNEFLYDDTDNIVNNNFIKSWKNLPDMFTNKYFTLAQEKSYRPIVTLSYFTDYSLCKLNVVGWHITNILFHLGNAVLVYLLIGMVLKDNKVSLITALLFCLHPIHTEVVNLSCFREDLISLLFFLLSFLCYVIYIQKQGKKIVLYILSLLLFVFAIFTKEMALTLPFVLALYEYYYNNPKKNSIIRFLNRIIKSPYYWGYFIIIGFFFIQRIYLLRPVGHVMGHNIVIPTGYIGGSLYTTMLTMIRAAAYYIQLLVFPLNLSIEHVIEEYSGINLPIIFSASIMIIILYFAIKSNKYSKGISFSIFYYFIALIPVSNIVPIGATIAERYLYFPLIGFCLLLGVISVKITDTGNRGFRLSKGTSYVLIVIILSLYSGRTYIRNRDFKEELTFWSKNLQANPQS